MWTRARAHMPHGCAMSTLSYLFSRLLQIIPTFLIVMVIIFLLVRALPGDPAIAMADAKQRPNSLSKFANAWDWISRFGFSLAFLSKTSSLVISEIQF